MLPVFPLEAMLAAFPLDVFADVERAVPEGYGEVAVTVVVAFVVLTVRHVSANWCERHAHELAWARLAVSGVATVLTAVGVVTLIAVWGLWTPLVRSFERLGLTSLGGELVLSAVLVGGAYALTTLLRQVITELARRDAHISDHQREVSYRLVQVTLYAVAGLTVVSLFTNDPSSLIVGAGFVGIVVGMAARQTLGAVLAGFVLMFSRPFEVGDWVEIGEEEGVVTEISIVNTRLQTFDGEYIMLPNDTVSGSAITNRTRKGRLRIEVEVGVDYEDDPRRAADVALEATRGVDEVLTVPNPQVVMKRFADSAVVLGIRFWIDNPTARRKWRSRTGVIAAVKEAFQREDLTIPFPQRTLSGREDGPITLAEGDVATAATRHEASDGEGGSSSGEGRQSVSADGGASSGRSPVATPEGESSERGRSDAERAARRKAEADDDRPGADGAAVPGARRDTEREDQPSGPGREERHSGDAQRRDEDDENQRGDS